MKISKEELERSLAESLARRKADEEDRRRRRGKYAPPTGVCRVCGGAVTGKIEYPSDGRIGGPPRSGYVGSWSCDSCFLVYSQCPSPAEACSKCNCSACGKRPCRCWVDGRSSRAVQDERNRAMSECSLCAGTGRVPPSGG